MKLVSPRKMERKAYRAFWKEKQNAFYYKVYRRVIKSLYKFSRSSCSFKDEKKRTLTMTLHE